MTPTLWFPARKAPLVQRTVRYTLMCCHIFANQRCNFDLDRCHNKLALRPLDHVSANLNYRQRIIDDHKFLMLSNDLFSFFEWNSRWIMANLNRELTLIWALNRFPEVLSVFFAINDRNSKSIRNHLDLILALCTSQRNELFLFLYFHLLSVFFRFETENITNNVVNIHS